MIPNTSNNNNKKPRLKFDFPLKTWLNLILLDERLWKPISSSIPNISIPTPQPLDIKLPREAIPDAIIKISPIINNKPTPIILIVEFSTTTNLKAKYKAANYLTAIKQLFPKSNILTLIIFNSKPPKEAANNPIFSINLSNFISNNISNTLNKLLNLNFSDSHIKLLGLALENIPDNTIRNLVNTYSPTLAPLMAYNNSITADDLINTIRKIRYAPKLDERQKNILLDVFLALLSNRNINFVRKVINLCKKITNEDIRKEVSHMLGTLTTFEKELLMQGRKQGRKEGIKQGIFRLAVKNLKLTEDQQNELKNMLKAIKSTKKLLNIIDHITDVTSWEELKKLISTQA